MGDVRVSLVMIVRNGERFLGDAITSAFAQHRVADEILVVDGHSTDDSVSIASAHGLEAVQQPGTGIGDARNHGIAHTSGELVAFLDCDDIWLPHKLAAQIDALAQNPDASYSLTKLQRKPLENAAIHPNNRVLMERPPVVGWTPSALVARRSLFEQFGTFDESLGVGVDMDFFARLIDYDVTNEIIDEVLVHKRIHDTNESADVGSNKRDMLRVARRSIERRRER